MSKANGKPAKGRIHAFIPRKLKRLAQMKAVSQGKDLTEVLIELLTEYTKDFKVELDDEAEDLAPTIAA